MSSLPGDILNVSTPSGSVGIEIAPCFVAGSLVHLADGTTKVIEEISIGDQVRGAFGESNEVLALHRPILGNFMIIRINDEHTTTMQHPHVGPNRSFFCGDPALLLENNVQTLKIGTILQTHQGPKAVDKLERIPMPADTQLYNLVVSNSHTYIVEGYAVVGWPFADDFNYDTWQPCA